MIRAIVPKFARGLAAGVCIRGVRDEPPPIHKQENVMADYGQGMGALSNAALHGIQQGRGFDIANTYAAPAVPPPTLNSAMSSLGELNSQLMELRERCYGLAQTIGGPFPCATSNSADVAKPASAIAQLNDMVSSAHRTVSEIKQAMDAMTRSLS